MYPIDESVMRMGLRWMATPCHYINREEIITN